MKLSITFLLLFGYSALEIEAGSDHEHELGFAVSADDFPYVTIDFLDWSWDYLLSKLRNIDKYMNKLLRKHHDLLLDPRNFEITRFLQDPIIQHCIVFHLKAEFTKDVVNLMRDAVKIGLQISKARIESGASNRNSEAAVDSLLPIFKKIETLLQAQRDKDESFVARMLDKAKYAVSSCINEYVTISLANAEIANFLSELFTFMDKGFENDDSYYISKIITKEDISEPEKQERGDFKIEKDATNLMTLFLSSHSIVEDYNANPPRNHQQIVFQNLLIRNHCARKHSLDELPPEFKKVVDKAFELKTKRASSLLQQSIDVIFKHPRVDCTVVGKRDTSLTLADLRSDPIFSEVRLLDDYNNAKRNKNRIIDTVDIIIGSWIEEKILISTISREMYLPVSKIFNYIDDASDESKEAVDAVLALPTEQDIWYDLI